MAFTVAILMCQLLWAVAATYIRTSFSVSKLILRHISYIYTAKPTRLNKKWTIECNQSLHWLLRTICPLRLGSKQLWLD